MASLVNAARMVVSKISSQSTGAPSGGVRRSSDPLGTAEDALRSDQQDQDEDGEGAHVLQLGGHPQGGHLRSEEHTSELQSLMRISYAVFCLKKKKKTQKTLILSRQHTNTPP